jgi:drug/metabolite transporter (DMT)-like permease
MAVSGLSFAAMGVLVKRLAPSFSSIELVFYRSFFNLVLIGPWLWFRGVELAPPGRGILLLRGVWGFLGLSSYFYSLSLLPLSLAALLVHCAPIFVVIVGMTFLREKLSLIQGAAIIGAVAGLGLLLQADLGKIAGPAIAVGIASALFLALAQVTVRASVNRFPGLLIVFYLVATSTLVSLPILVVQGAALPEASEIPLLFLMSLAAAGGQIASTHAFHFAPAAVVSAGGTFNAAFPILFGATFLGESLLPAQWGGACLLIGAILGLTMQRMKPTKE